MSKSTRMGVKIEKVTVSYGGPKPSAGGDENSKPKASTKE